MCELYKDQLITIRYNGNIYYGPIKLLYQTFFDKVIEVVCGNQWVSAKIIGEPSAKQIYRINDSLICSGDLIITTLTFNKITATITYENPNKVIRDFNILGSSKTKVSDLTVGIKFIPNRFDAEKISCYATGSNAYINKIEKTDIISDWLFGIEFIDQSYEYYALTNGMIVFIK